MWKVMLVDDEPFIRRGLKILISWEQYGYEIVAEAENGEQALEKLGKEEIDLVFVDLKMPGMSGLEMIEYARQNYGEKPDFVILTGFAEFDYAKEAIRLSVRDYLLKPIQEKELVHILKSLSEEYKRQKSEKEEPVSVEEPEVTVIEAELGDRRSGKALEKVEQYIQEHYCENLSLVSLGEKFYINNVYLGQIFKKSMEFLSGII